MASLHHTAEEHPPHTGPPRSKIIFYAAEFGIIGNAFNRTRKMGFVLLGCLIYLFAG